MADMSSIVQISKEVLRFTSPLTWLVVDTTEKIINKSNEVTSTGNLENMKEEALRQEISLKMLEAQARVAQEISIARRIDTAEEVIIEEFYDKSGKGGIGGSVKGTSVSLGLDVSERSITKRIYRFKGWRDGGLETVEKMTAKDQE